MKITIEGNQDQIDSIDFSFIDDQKKAENQEDDKFNPLDVSELDTFDPTESAPFESNPLRSPTSASSPAPTGEPLFTPFTVIVDTREQTPWHFGGLTKTKIKQIKGVRHKIVHPLVVGKKVSTLKSGDYSLEGFEDRISIERKSFSDLFGTLLADRDRFKRELERLADESYSPPNGYSAVVVESSLSMIINNNEYDHRKIKSVIGSIMAFDQRYPTSWWFLPTRVKAEQFAFRALERFWNDHDKKE